MAERKKIYEFRFVCLEKDFDNYRDILNELETVGWYNHIDVELMRVNGNRGNMVEFFGVCLPIGARDLIAYLGKKIEFNPKKK